MSPYTNLKYVIGMLVLVIISIQPGQCCTSYTKIEEVSETDSAGNRMPITELLLSFGASIGPKPPTMVKRNLSSSRELDNIALHIYDLYPQLTTLIIVGTMFSKRGKIPTLQPHPNLQILEVHLALVSDYILGHMHDLFPQLRKLVLTDADEQRLQPHSDSLQELRIIKDPWY